MDSEKPQSDKRRQAVNFLVALGIFFAVALISLGDLGEIIPFFAPVTDSSMIRFFHDIKDLLAISIILFATYKYRARLGIALTSFYFVVHIPYFIVRFPEDSMEVLHIIFGCIVIFFGIWLINQLHKNEARLSVSEERYRTLVENALVGVYRTNLKGDILYVNNALVSMLGFDSAEEMIAGGAVVRYKNPSDRAILIRELTEKGKVNSFEFEVLTKTGEIKDVILGAILEGNILSGMLLDITERKKAEERISHLTDVLKAVRNVNQLITHEKDREGLIRKSCDLLVQRGYQRAWILLLDENKKSGTVASNGFDKDTSVFLQQLETGDYPECLRELMAQGQAIITYNQPGKRHAGCVLAGRHSGQDVSRGKLEHEGKLYGVMGVSIPQGIAFDKEEQELFFELCSDIGFALASIESDNKRKQAEESLQTSEENFRHSVDDSPLGIRILDAQGKTVYANQALLEIYGLTDYEELNTIPNANIYTPEAYTAHRNRVEKRSKGEYVPPRYEVSIIRPDGKIRHLQVVRKDVIWNGKPQFQQLYQDITEVKNLQEQLIMQDRLVSIGQLVSGVAHELNNPLTSVIGFSELLLQRQLPDDIRADVMIVNQEAQRTSSIVKNLLTFARQRPQEKSPIQISEPIKTVLQLRNHEHTVNSIRVNTSFAHNLPLVMANSSQLQQVFFNLVTNAEFAMTEAHNKGTMTITTERAGDFVRVSITDDGPGIAPENMKRLFSPFFTTKELGKGTGLGLSICQGIIAEHGGKIWAESEPGKGATFKVELPICGVSKPQNDNK